MTTLRARIEAACRDARARYGAWVPVEGTDVEIRVTKLYGSRRAAPGPAWNPRYESRGPGAVVWCEGSRVLHVGGISSANTFARALARQIEVGASPDAGTVRSGTRQDDPATDTTEGK